MSVEERKKEEEERKSVFTMVRLTPGPINVSTKNTGKQQQLNEDVQNLDQLQVAR